MTPFHLFTFSLTFPFPNGMGNHCHLLIETPLEQFANPTVGPITALSVNGRTEFVFPSDGFAAACEIGVDGGAAAWSSLLEGW